MLSSAPLHARIRDERGFTLMETLVAMVTGVIVTGALFAILEFSVHQTSRISQVAQASQVSRTAMTRIVNEMHSACLSPKFAPVQGTSTPSLLVLQNGYSEQAEVPGVYTTKGGSTGTKIEGVRQDSIFWDVKTKLLTDTVQLGTGPQVSGVYPVSATKSSVRLAEQVTQAEVIDPKKEPQTAIFRYYKYAPTSAPGEGEAAATLKEIELKTPNEELKAAAAEVAAVQVSFRTGSYTKEVKLGTPAQSTTSADLTTLTTFAFSAPDSEATIVAGPCE